MRSRRVRRKRRDGGAFRVCRGTGDGGVAIEGVVTCEVLNPFETVLVFSTFFGTKYFKSAWDVCRSIRRIKGIPYAWYQVVRRVIALKKTLRVQSGMQGVGGPARALASYSSREKQTSYAIKITEHVPFSLSRTVSLLAYISNLLDLTEQANNRPTENRSLLRKK